MGATHHFMGATQHFMVATLCAMGAMRPLMGSMVISRLTYQYLDLYYLQFVDKNNFYFWLPYHALSKLAILGIKASRLLGHALYLDLTQNKFK